MEIKIPLNSMIFHLVVLFVAYSVFVSKANSTTRNSVESILNSPKCKEYPINNISK